MLNDDVAKVVMMFVGLWLLGTLMSHAQTSLSSKQDIGKRHELYFGVGLLNLYVIDKHDKLTKPIPECMVSPAIRKRQRDNIS